MFIPDPKSKFLDLEDVKMHYLEWGETEKTPMVMLHGWKDSAWLFKRLGRFFEKDFHLFSLDLRGHGQTPDVSTEKQPWVGDLANFLDKLDLKEVILIGYSFGANIAYRYVSENPARIKALSIIDIGVENTPVTFNPGATPQKIQGSVERAWKRIEKIPCPTLLIKAEHSHLLNQEVAEKMVKVMPDARLVVIPGADHQIFTRYEDLAGALQQFLNNLASRHLFN